MRLIDADKFRKRIAAAEKANLFMKLLDMEETAYDVDKVVEQLESEYKENVDSDTGEPCNNWAVDMQNDMIGNHIEIIRKGGMINRLD